MGTKKIYSVGGVFIGSIFFLIVFIFIGYVHIRLPKADIYVSRYFPFMFERNPQELSDEMTNTNKIYASIVSAPAGRFPQYDIHTDSSYQKFVSPEYSVRQKQYTPDDLEVIENTSVLHVRNHTGMLRKKALASLHHMASGFFSATGKPLVLVSTYRGYFFQQKLIQGYTDTLGPQVANRLSALPGHSEHQLGLAIDVFATSATGKIDKKRTTSIQRLQQHAHMYGRTQSYQKGPLTDGYMVEPRHRRYVGEDLATFLYLNRLTFAEYAHFQLTREKK